MMTEMHLYIKLLSSLSAVRLGCFTCRHV